MTRPGDADDAAAPEDPPPLAPPRRAARLPRDFAARLQELIDLIREANARDVTMTPQVEVAVAALTVRLRELLGDEDEP